MISFTPSTAFITTVSPISKVTVETFGSDYGLPETLETWDYYQWIYETYGINLQQTITE